MSILQYGIHLWPLAELPRTGRALDELRKDDLAGIRFWTRVQPPADFGVQLARLMPETPHGAPAARRWGGEGSDHVEVWYQEQRLAQVTARFMVCKLDRTFERGVVELARRWHCFLAEEFCQGVFMPSFDVLHSHILASPYKRFADDLQVRRERHVLDDQAARRAAIAALEGSVCAYLERGAIGQVRVLELRANDWGVRLELESVPLHGLAEDWPKRFQISSAWNHLTVSDQEMCASRAGWMLITEPAMAHRILRHAPDAPPEILPADDLVTGTLT